MNSEQKKKINKKNVHIDILNKKDGYSCLKRTLDKDFLYYSQSS